jgi:hypothetical protein
VNAARLVLRRCPPRWGAPRGGPRDPSKLGAGAGGRLHTWSWLAFAANQATDGRLTEVSREPGVPLRSKSSFLPFASALSWGAALVITCGITGCTTNFDVFLVGPDSGTDAGRDVTSKEAEADTAKTDGDAAKPDVGPDGPCSATETFCDKQCCLSSSACGTGNNCCLPLGGQGCNNLDGENGPPPCCGSNHCTGAGTCASSCSAAGDPCSQGSGDQCCWGQTYCGDAGTCATCIAHDEPCASNTECCSGFCKAFGDAGKTCHSGGG